MAELGGLSAKLVDLQFTATCLPFATLIARGWTPERCWRD